MIRKTPLFWMEKTMKPASKPPLGNTERFSALKAQLSTRKTAEKPSALSVAVGKKKTTKAAPGRRGD